MTIQASTRAVGDVAIVDISGQLRLGEGTGKLRDVVQQLSHDGYRKILLNLSEMDYIDSNGLGELVQSLKTSKRFGASLRLAGRALLAPLVPPSRRPAFDAETEAHRGARAALGYASPGNGQGR
jgi:anti-sigma B factor antagonist